MIKYPCNGKLVQYPSCDVGVHMRCHITFQVVGSIKVLCDVSASILSYQKFTAWVIILELFNIYDNILQKNDVFPFIHTLVKFFN